MSLANLVPARLRCAVAGHDLTQVAGILYRRGWCRRCGRTVLLGP